jgi:hypothetical protein
VERREVMPLYKMRWMFKDGPPKFMTGKPQDCEPPARGVVESFGGRLHHCCFISGEQDAS